MQFHWTNAGYRDFADFLSTLNHSKRANIRQERRKLDAAGITFVRLTGADIDSAQWRFFYRCYTGTYRQHHSTPYLTLEFFERIGSEMPDNVLLVLGLKSGRPVCAALDIYSRQRTVGPLLGRDRIRAGLHFEACYYQAIEFCIERRHHPVRRRCAGCAQARTRPAAGGDTVGACHRGSRLCTAIAKFVRHERDDVAQTVDELERASPFRQATEASVLDSGSS